jgi:thiamine-monophosphate kinase
LLDDAAVIAPLSGHELVAKTDAIVVGVHFLHGDPPDLIARKALRARDGGLANGSGSLSMKGRCRWRA